jgi:hypothetical protein
MYIMDFLGMLGIPLVPVHRFPENAPVIFLPAQAAADPDLLDHVNKAGARGAQLILTTNLLIASRRGDELARMAGVDPNLQSRPMRAQLAPESQGEKIAIDLESPIEGKAGHGNIVCTSGDRKVALLIVDETPQSRIALLNTHTYSQADFDAVGEVLLCPRPPGLISLEGPPLAALRKAFRGATSPIFDGPSGVTFHPFWATGDAGFVVQNFNAQPASVTVGLRNLTIPARGRVWVQEAQRETPSP